MAHRSWLVWIPFVLALSGCAIPILSRKTVIDPEPAPVCKIEKAPGYVQPAPGPLAQSTAPASGGAKR